MRLGVKVGQGCTALMDAKMRNLPCQRLEMDEIWGFVGKKERNVRMEDKPELGSVWTFCAIDADTKLVPAFKGRTSRPGDPQAALCRMYPSGWLTGQSTDGLKSYIAAIDKSFGADVDYAQIIKIYGNESLLIWCTARRVSSRREAYLHWQPERRPHLDKLHRTVECHDSAAYAETDPAHAGLL